MSRALDTHTLDNAARHYAAEFLRPDVPHASVEGKFVGGRAYVLQDFFNFTYKDEFNHLLSKIRGQLGPDALAEFDALAKDKFTPRSDDVLSGLLAEKLAVDTDGNHIPGKIGTVRRDNRYIGEHLIEVETPASLKRRRELRELGQDPGERQTHMRMAHRYWPIYAGETEERIALMDDGGRVPDADPMDPTPPGTPGMSVGALATRIALAVAIVMCDGAVDALDGGSLGAVLEGRTTPRPSNVDDAATGTLLFTLNANTTTTFGNATDAGPGAIATANAIDDDVSADDTGTLAYVRASSSSVTDTPLLDVIEGEAGTSGADFNFNTLAIVAGAIISLTAWTVTQPEG